MNFVYDLLPRFELEARITKEGRVYSTPYGDLPSVTNVLAKKLKSKKLEEWKIRVGKKEAANVSQLACSIGNSVHEICEQYLLGNHLKDLMPSTLAMFSQIRKILDQNITKIYGIEFPLCSPILHTAGRADGLVQWEEKNAILDFKTARKTLDKGDDRVLKYNLQATVYAMMAEEIYQMDFPYNVVLVVPKDFDFPQVIIKSNKKYRSFVQQLFNDRKEK